MNSELTEIKADVKTLLETSKLKQHEDDRKYRVLFDHMNETNKGLSALAENVKNVTEDFKDHRRNHFSWIKINYVFDTLLRNHSE